jgi:hypothetical protein
VKVERQGDEVLVDASPTPSPEDHASNRMSGSAAKAMAS